MDWIVQYDTILANTDTILAFMNFWGVLGKTPAIFSGVRKNLKLGHFSVFNPRRPGGGE